MDKDWFKKMFLDEAKKACVRHSSAPSTSTPDTPDAPEEENQIEDKGVLFIDYDGKYLYSYTVQEAKALTELPPLPEHEGLICQGWNWTLDQIKEQDGEVVVGPHYITDDGATRLYISVDESTRRVPIHVSNPSSSSSSKPVVSIDWGDELQESHEILYNSGRPKCLVHEYARPGNYIISITSTDKYSLGHQNNINDYPGLNMFYEKEESKYNTILKKIETGEKVKFETWCFYKCSSLETVTIPEEYGGVSHTVFKRCTALKAFVGLPGGIECFYGCTKMKIVSMSCGMTSLSGTLFDGCSSLLKAPIPYTVTSCGSGNWEGGAWGYQSCGVFRGCTKLSLPKIPPKVTSLGYNFFSGVKTFSKLVLPDNITSLSWGALRGCAIEEIDLNNASPGQYALDGNYKLKSVKFPSKKSSIGERALRGAVKLRKLVLPSLSSIGTYAFDKCVSLEEIIFEGDVTSIAEYGISWLPSLKILDFSACTSVPTLSAKTSITSKQDVKILVPGALYNQWLAATNWVDHGTRLVPVGEVVGENAIGTWVFNETLTGELEKMSVNMTTDHRSFSSYPSDDLDHLSFDGTELVIYRWTDRKLTLWTSSGSSSSNGWTGGTSQSARTIHIVAGADAVNPILIEWLKANATKTS